MVKLRYRKNFVPNNLLLLNNSFISAQMVPTLQQRMIVQNQPIYVGMGRQLLMKITVQFLSVTTILISFWNHVITAREISSIALVLGVNALMILGLLSLQIADQNLLLM